MIAWQVMGAMHAYAAAHEKDGAFAFADASGKTIPLDLVQIHQTVGRSKTGGGCLACAEFRNLGAATATYDVDFWLDANAGFARGQQPPPSRNLPRHRQSPSQSPCRSEASTFDVVE